MARLVSLAIQEHKNKTTHTVNWFYSAEVEVTVDGVPCLVTGLMSPDLNPVFCRIILPAGMAGRICEKQFGTLAAGLIKKYLKEQEAHSFKAIARKVVAGASILALASIFTVLALNWVLFPDCGREGECFLLNGLWR